MLADWQSHDALAENAWYLTGTEGTDISCTQGSRCTFAEVLDRLNTHDDTDAEDPAISTGVYFALGSGIPAPTETAVDAFVFNNFRFNFEPMGVFVTPTPKRCAAAPTPREADPRASRAPGGGARRTPWNAHAQTRGCRDDLRLTVRR